jgi:hypothetical protein
VKTRVSAANRCIELHGTWHILVRTSNATRSKTSLRDNDLIVVRPHH